MRATQFWDKGRLASHSMGEHDRRSVVWDYIAVYRRWSSEGAVYHGGPVVRVRDRPAPRWSGPWRASR